jgi:hypothetical protein
MLALTDRPGIQHNDSPLQVTGNDYLPEANKDTVLVFKRNIISDFTFYDPANIITRIDLNSSETFPFTFIDKNREIEARAREKLISELKPGADLPFKSLQKDWGFGVLFVSILLFTLVSITSKTMLPGVSRFFLFKGVSDFVKKDSRGLLMWQGLVLNIATLFTLAFFCYSVAAIYEIIPSGIGGLLFWLIAVASITALVLLRHIVCIVTGNMSGESEVFNEYLNIIYSSYRFSALFLFIIIVLMHYTVMLPETSYIIPGAIVFFVMYLFRLVRLIYIFIKRGISIFYLILYLCALEFLPVVVSIKYFTGLV